MKRARTVYDALGQHEEAQEHYRSNQKFRDAIDEMEACRYMAEKNLTEEEYACFISELRDMIRKLR